MFELVAILLGMGRSDAVTPELERALGRLVLQYGTFHFEKQNGGCKPVITMTAEIDLRKLLVS